MTIYVTIKCDFRILDTFIKLYFECQNVRYPFKSDYCNNTKKTIIPQCRNNSKIKTKLY